MTTQDAMTAYTVGIEQVKQLLDRLTAWAAEMGECAPEAVNWPQVGDARHVRELLAEAVAFVEGGEA